MNVRRAGALMRRVWPLQWPVAVRSRVLPYPDSGYARSVYRWVTGPRGGRKWKPTHLIVLCREHATAETLIHEWTHAARHEVMGDDDLCDAHVDSLEYELHGHDDKYWLAYGRIYRAMARFFDSAETGET